MESSLVAQEVKYLPAMHKTGVQFLSQEDPPEKEMVTHSSILAWRIPQTEGPWGRKEPDMTEQLTHTHIIIFSLSGFLWL